MNDLIRREDAIREIAEMYMYESTMEYIDASDDINEYIDDVREFLKDIPSVDAVSVVQGKWKAKSFHEVYCDNCGFAFDIMKCDFLESMKFCPNCGADMRGERREP